MANNTVLSTMTGGDTIQTVDNTTYKTQVVAVANSTGANIATVKVASTAIAATDLPIAVGLHPTSPLPAGTNAIGTVIAGAGSASIGSVSLNAGVAIVGALVANQSVNVVQQGGTAIVTGGIAGSVGVGGITPSATAATGYPVRVGAIARTTNSVAVTDGQVSNVMTDKMGRVVVVQGQVRDLVGKQGTTITSSTVATTVLTAIASTFTDITSFTATNGSATATTIALSDGTTSMTFNLGAGGGITIPFNPPLPATTVNVAWTVTCGTSVASVYVSVAYVKNI